MGMFQAKSSDWIATLPGRANYRVIHAAPAFSFPQPRQSRSYKYHFVVTV